MSNLFKAFLFKLKKDLTFRITLFVGLGLSIFMVGLFFAIDQIAASLSDGEDIITKSCTGQNLFMSSISPVQNFGIAIPVNLISFTVLEFTQGTIRNKIITGNSKQKIYISLFFAGLVFTLALLISYVLLCVGLASIFGGFDINGPVMTGFAGGFINPEFFVKTIVITILVYITIASITIFFATLFRNIGPSIPVVIILLMMLYMASTVFPLFSDEAADVLRFINPLHAIMAVDVDTSTLKLTMDNTTFIAGIVNNLVVASIFFVGGLLIFSKRDVK